MFERRFVVRQRNPDIPRFLGVATLDLDDGQDVFSRLVQRGDDLLPGQHDSVGAVDAALDLDEPQMTRAGSKEEMS